MANLKAKPSCRAPAAKALSHVIGGGQSLNKSMALYGQKVAAKDRALFSQLCYGTLRFYPRFAEIIDGLMSKPLKKKDQDIYALLLIGCYQLEGMRIPDHAAISTVVDACKQLKKPWASGLVNGVLREFQRRQDSIQSSLSASAIDAHPPWLSEKIQAAWPEQYSDIIAANNSQPPFCLRVNWQHNSTGQYLLLLKNAGIEASACSHAETGIRLKNAVDVNELPGFNLGWVSIQDEAAQLAAQLLNPQPGMRILDACAAPGGKTGHILEAAPDLTLLAIDNDPVRLESVSDNLQRLGLHAELRLGDAGNTESWYENTPFDRILLDAPCSGTGVIRRHPDIKLLRRRQDIPKLAELQLSILSALWPCLTHGGYLLYATCSVLPQENHQVIQEFLQQEPSAESKVIDAQWGTASELGRQILPELGQADGFFYSLLYKH